MKVQYSWKKASCLLRFTHAVILCTFISMETVTDIQSFVETMSFRRRTSANHISSPFHIILLPVCSSSSEFRTKSSLKSSKVYFGMWFGVPCVFQCERVNGRLGIQRETIFLSRQKEKENGFFTVFFLSPLNYKHSTIGMCSTMLPPYIPDQCVLECNRCGDQPVPSIGLLCDEELIEKVSHMRNINYSSEQWRRWFDLAFFNICEAFLHITYRKGLVLQKKPTAIVLYFTRFNVIVYCNAGVAWNTWIQYRPFLTKGESSRGYVNILHI